MPSTLATITAFNLTFGANTTFGSNFTVTPIPGGTRTSFGLARGGIGSNQNNGTVFGSILAGTAPYAAPNVALTSDTGRSSTDRITSNGALTITGIANDAALQYSINNGQTWSNGFTAIEGNNAILIRQVVAGLTSDATTFNFTLDRNIATPLTALALDSGSSSSDRLTNSGVVNLTGLEADANWQYSTTNGTTWIDGSGTSFTLTGDGVKSAIVRQTDVAGNVSLASNPLTFTLDTIAPTKTVTLTSMTKDTGTSATDFITSDGSAGRIYSGTVSATLLTASESVQVSVDNGTTWANATVNNRAWTYTDNTAKTSNWNIQVRVADIAGNGGTVTNRAVTLDQAVQIAGAITLDLVTASDAGFSNTDNLTNVARPRLEVKFDSATAQAGDSIQILNSNNIVMGTATLTAAQATAGTVTLTLAIALTSGVNTIRALYRDRSGNTITSASNLDITLETEISAASAVTLDLLDSSDTGVSTSDNITTVALPTFAVTFDPARTQAGDLIEVRRGSTVLGSTTLNATQASTGSLTLTLTTALSNGNNTLTAIHRDAAGNIATSPTALVVTRDNTVPTTPVVVGFTSTSLTGTTEANATLLVSTSATTPTSFVGATATANASGQYTLDLSSLPGAPDGVTYYLYAQDRAGNVSLASSRRIVVGTGGATLVNRGGSGSDLLMGSSGVETAQYTVASNAIALTGAVTATTLATGSINVRTANIDVLTSMERLTFAGTGYTGIGTGINQLRSTVQTTLGNNAIAQFVGTYDTATGIFTLGGATPNATLVAFDANASTSTNYEAFLLLGKTSPSGTISLTSGTVTLTDL